MNNELERLKQELEKYKQWINDLQNGMYINCVYCGHRYGTSDEVPCSMAEVLKKHVMQCENHPMSKLLTMCKKSSEVLREEMLHRVQLDGDVAYKDNEKLQELKSEIDQTIKEVEE